MVGMRHRTRHLAGHGLVLLSMSALLALACFPAVSNAQDSSGVQYTDALPTATGKVARESPASSSSSGRDADGSGQSSTRSGSTDGSKSGSESDGRSSGAESGDESGGGAAAGGGKGGSGPNPGKQSGDAGRQPAEATGAVPTSDEGGSSPLVAILIAIAVLAAISIGVVAMRRKGRDSDPGASVSPEAS